MKILCTKLLDASGVEVSSSPWVKLGRIYVVLTFSIDTAGRARVRIVDDQGGKPGIFSLEQFEIVDHTIPINWEVSQRLSGDFFFGPAAWSAPGYWSRYVEDDPEAVRIFESEYIRIVGE